MTRGRTSPRSRRPSKMFSRTTSSSGTTLVRQQSLRSSCRSSMSSGSEEEVSKFLGCAGWIPTQRFEVVQKNKVRGCDSATSNLINQTAVITEKLELTSTDLNVAGLRELRTRAGDRPLQGWVLDERKAYRQLPIRPDHRKSSVICLEGPDDGVPKFFVMIGHSFGLVAAVYNYNRRSAAISDILVHLFNMVAFNFYDSTTTSTASRRISLPPRRSSLPSRSISGLALSSTTRSSSCRSLRSFWE